MTAGTMGQSLLDGAVKIKISGMIGGITYRSYIKDKGWTFWEVNGTDSYEKEIILCGLFFMICWIFSIGKAGHVHREKTLFGRKYLFTPLPIWKKYDILLLQGYKDYLYIIHHWKTYMSKTELWSWL